MSAGSIVVVPTGASNTASFLGERRKKKKRKKKKSSTLFCLF
jgi:hypothetical protein